VTFVFDTGVFKANIMKAAVLNVSYPSVIVKPDLLREVVSKYIDHFFPK